ALGDGTIRWYNIANGEELITFFPHKDGKRWIAWTPSGYYMSSGADAENLIGWHINQGSDKEPLFYPASAFAKTYKRPDIVKKILETLDEAEAIRLANSEAGITTTPTNIDEESLAEVTKKYQLNLKPSGLGKAIIVAASGAQDKNTLFPYTLEYTTEMYRFLHTRGFSDDDVIFMNPRTPIVPVGNYPDAARQDYLMHDPKKELQQAIEIAANELKAGQQFVFYLHGHARTDSIELGNQTELKAEEFKTWLEQIPTDVEQIIILDTCYSGSFINELATTTSNRIIVTSADEFSEAWSQESMSFAEYFIRYLKTGSSIGETFELTQYKMQQNPKFFSYQQPQLYDGRDGQRSRNVFIGGQKTAAAQPPEIIDIHPVIYLNKEQTTATIWVKTFPDLNSIRRVRAVLVNEQDQLAEYNGQETHFSRRELELKANSNLERYEIEYDQFHTAQDWTILYQAQDIEGQWSEIAMGYASSQTQSSNATVQLAVDKTDNNVHVEILEQFSIGYDLYIALIAPDGNYLTVTGKNDYSINDDLDNLKPWYGNHSQSEALLVIDTPLDNFPFTAKGQYCIYAVLSPEQNDVIEAMEQNLTTFDMQCFDL
ncbi:MAG: C13 family peptidase, partial [Thiotrichaceae bacterium]|nr:C13 family peptidase [Thiotrichaceae bacterium]